MRRAMDPTPTLLVLLVASAAAVHVRAQQSEGPVFNMTWGFESATGAVQVAPFVPYINATNCTAASCPNATWATSQDAARTGSWGLRFTITKPPRADNAWRVHLKLPRFVLDPARFASVCLWARHTNPQAALSMFMYQLPRENVHIFKKAMAFNDSDVWQRFCFQELEVTYRSAFYIQLELGGAAGVVDIDDVNMVVEPLPGLDDTLAWLGAADARIPAIRRGNLTLQFLDAGTGQPITSLPGGLMVVQRRHDFWFGTSFAPEQLEDPEDKAFYQDTTVNMPFNALTTENIFKWPVYEPWKGGWDTSKGVVFRDYFMFASSRGIRHIRGHALEWYRAEYDGHFSRAAGCGAYPDMLREHITREVMAMTGVFQSYDVINELLHENGFYTRCGFNLTLIVNMFKWAREANPTVQLCINDYGLIEWDEAGMFVAQVQALLDMGAPVQCVGVQAHLTLGTVSHAAHAARLERIASLGLPIYISEVSLRTGWDVKKNTPLNVMDDDLQAAWLDQLYRLWFSHPAVKGIWLWGWWDKVHWIPHGGLYDVTGQPKAAAAALQRLIRVRWNTTAVAVGPLALGRLGAARLPAYYGTYEVRMGTTATRVVTATVEFPASKGPNQLAVIRVPPDLFLDTLPSDSSSSSSSSEE